MEEVATIQQNLFKMLNYFVKEGGLKISVCNQPFESTFEHYDEARTIPKQKMWRIERIPSSSHSSLRKRFRSRFASGNPHQPYRENFRRHSLDSPFMSRIADSQRQCNDQIHQLRGLRDQRERDSSLGTAINYGDRYDAFVSRPPDGRTSVDPVRQRRVRTQFSTPAGYSPHQTDSNCSDGPVDRQSGRALTTMGNSSTIVPGHPANGMMHWLSPLVSAFNELFSTTRVDTLNKLNSTSGENKERAQRIIYHAIKTAFNSTRQLVRRACPLTDQSNGPPGQTNQFNRCLLNGDQLNRLVSSVLQTIERCPPLLCACHICYSSPGPLDDTKGRCKVSRDRISQWELNCLNKLCRELCPLAWKLQIERLTRNQHSAYEMRTCYVDIKRPTRPGDLFNEKCYRRSYDSDKTSCRIHHYIWPCLVLFDKPVPARSNGSSGMSAYVIAKGEVCTRHPCYSASKQDQAEALMNSEYGHPQPTRNERTYAGDVLLDYD